MIRSSLLAIALMLWICGCAPWSLVEAGRVTMNGRYTIETPIDWSALDDGDVVIWTVDGTRLQMIIYFNGIEDGDPLFELPALADFEEKERAHRFRSEMDAFEVRELFVNTWTRRQKWNNVEGFDLRPAKFGPWRGFRFEFECLSDNGLEYQGFLTGAVVESRLYMIVFQAPRQHYYPTYVDRAEAIVRSIQKM